jgi:hypothetical protein
MRAHVLAQRQQAEHQEVRSALERRTRELTKQELHWARLRDALPVGIVVLNATTSKISYVNEACASPLTLPLRCPDLDLIFRHRVAALWPRPLAVA